MENGFRVYNCDPLKEKEKRGWYFIVFYQFRINFVVSNFIEQKKILSIL